MLSDFRNFRIGVALMKIELPWFDDCPNHEAAEQMLSDVLKEFVVSEPIQRTNVPDEATGNLVTFPR